MLNNALSGVDQALWDIKGKMAGMRKGPDILSGSPFPCRCSANLNRAPSAAVHDLLGGKVRKAAPCYVHADGFLPDDPDPATHFDEAKQLMAMGFWHVRLQHNGYGANIPVERPEPEVPRPAGAGDSPTEQVSIYDPISYVVNTPKMFACAYTAAPHLYRAGQGCCARALTLPTCGRCARGAGRRG